MATQSMSVGAEFEEYAAELVKTGRFADARGVFEAAKDAISRTERYQETLAFLKQAIAEGQARGIAEGDVFARVRERAGLPPRIRA